MAARRGLNVRVSVPFSGDMGSFSSVKAAMRSKCGRLAVALLISDLITALISSSESLPAAREVNVSRTGSGAPWHKRFPEIHKAFNLSLIMQSSSSRY